MDVCELTTEVIWELCIDLIKTHQFNTIATIWNQMLIPIKYIAFNSNFTLFVKPISAVQSF